MTNITRDFIRCRTVYGNRYARYIATTLLLMSFTIPVQLAYSEPAIGIRSVHCTDITATQMGVTIEFTVSGVEHDSTSLTYVAQVLSSGGSIVHSANIVVPASAPNPATTFIGFSLPLSQGTYTLRAIVGESQISTSVNVPNCSPPQPNTIVGQVCNVEGQNIICKGNVQGLEQGETVSLSGTSTGTLTTQCTNPSLKSKTPGGERFTGTQQFTAMGSTTLTGDANPSQVDTFSFPLNMQPAGITDCPSSQFKQIQTIRVGSFNVQLT